MPATTLAQGGDGARYRIEGTVVGPDGESVAGMEVSATLTEPWGETFIAETGADGRFEVEVREGPYLLVAPGLTIMQLPRGLGYCQSSVSGEIVLIYGCEDADFFAPAFAHEYARSLQHHLTEIGRPYASWLWTGITQYLQAQYLTRHGPSYEEHVRLRVVPRARWVTAPLRDMAGVIPANSDVAHLAVRLLVELTEEDALFEFLASLTVQGWEDAFHATLGMSLDEFYELFAVHRAEVAPPR